jgi:cell division protein FtsL
MNIESHNKKIKYKAEIMAGLVLVVFVSVGCISQLHSPWTCQQGKETWQKKQINQNNQNNQQLKQEIVNRDTIHLCF